MVAPRRANYVIVPSTGLLSMEANFQFFSDVPNLSLGDMNGDGRVDFVLSSRHEIFVFHRRPGGEYPYEPDQRLALRLVTPEQHIRGTGGVASEIKDINGDDKLDLLISVMRGGFADAETEAMVFLNHGNGWNLDRPDMRLGKSSSLISNALYDLDRDGQNELVKLEIRFSIPELIELIFARELDVMLSIYRWNDGSGFLEKPTVKKSFELPFDFDTMRLRGFVPVATVDLNADGYLDIVLGGDGSMLSIYLGDSEHPFKKRSGRQKMSTAGVIHFRDFNGDGLPDLVLFDPYTDGAALTVGINRGALPGTPGGLLARKSS